jgi:hypothetical protein
MKLNNITRGRSSDWVERTALAASLACLMHCLMLPLLFAALPVLSSLLPIPEAFHLWMVAVAVPLSSFALMTGQVQHGARLPLIIGLSGLVLLAAGAILFGNMQAETPVTVAGSAALAWAHVANWRLRHARGRNKLQPENGSQGGETGSQ